MSMRVTGKLGLAALLACTSLAAAQAKDPDGDWRTINRDLAATRFSPLKDINTGNVGQLKTAWTYPMRGFNTAVPLVVDGVMYFPAGQRVVALDADTGKEIWTHTAERPAPPPPPTDGAPPRPGGLAGGGPPGYSTRGLGYWPGDKDTPPRLLVMIGNRLAALDAATGAPVKSFGQDGSVEVGVGYGGTPTIAGDVAVIGAATLENIPGDPGNPRAFDVRTGRKLWEFWTVPRPGEPYNETWGDGWEGRSGANMWAFAAPVDEKLGVVYLPIAGPAANYWGGDRPGTNEFANSVVAVDLKTGKYRWHFQTVHHDLWDADFPSAGALVDLNIGGRRRPALTHVGKTSYFFTLDRSTGKPLIPVEERPVPKGDVPGEYYHPTQPFPVRPGPLSRVEMSKDDIVTAADTTPEHAAACQAMWEKAGGYYNAGPFTPFLYKEQGAPPRSTIQLPGGTGGVNWGGVAADPTTGWVFANAQATSLVGWVEKKPNTEPYAFDGPVTNQPYDRASVDGKGPFFGFNAPLGGKYEANGRAIGPQAPCYKPPWGRLTAVDANTGEIKWAVPLGITEQLPEGKQLTGNSGSAGPTVTAGGLVFVGATQDRRFRAFEAKTGRQLWETTLAANANANPMSYRGRSGRQYVAINASGVINVFALPEGAAAPAKKKPFLKRVFGGKSG